MEPAAASIPPRAPAAALLHDRQARRDAEFTVLDESFLACEDCVFELEASLAKSTPNKANFRSLLDTLQTELASTRADLAATLSSTAMAAFELDQLRADHRRLASQISTLTSTTDDMRLQLSNAQSSVSLAASTLFCNERDRYFGLPHSLVGQNDRLNRDFTTLLTRARDSCSSLCGGVGSLRKKFRASEEGDDGSEDTPAPPSTN